MIDAAEAQRIKRGDRPRAHGEDIPQDAADAGGGALVGLDERRMIVAFDLEGHRQAAADIDYTGIFTRTLQHMRPFGRQILEISSASFCSCNAPTT